MKLRIIATVALAFQLITSNASAISRVTCWTAQGITASFGETQQLGESPLSPNYSGSENAGYYACSEGFTDPNSKTVGWLQFVGFGAGLSLTQGSFQLIFLGPGDGYGNYYGMRAQAAFLVGANAITAIGKNGLIQIVGLDIGAGFDVSAVKVRYVKRFLDLKR